MTGSSRNTQPYARAQLPKDLQLAPGDRILVFAPHPDDEVLGTGGVLQDALKMNLPIHIVFLTYGDANEWSFAVYRKVPPLTPTEVRKMGEMRHNEAVSAAAQLGIPASDLTFLGYPDHNTLDIWNQHWASEPPAVGIFTRVTAVPYQDALHPGAAYKGDQILADVTAIVRDFRPTRIFVTSPADHNPDHRADYLFVRTALWDLEGELNAQVYPFLIHYPGYPPREIIPAASQLIPPRDLQSSINWISYNLNGDQVQKKLVALKKHGTQYRSNSRLLNRYVTSNELFGDYPVITIHPGQSADLQTLQERGQPSTALYEHLNDLERRTFVDIQGVTVQRSNDTLVFTLHTTRAIEPGASLSLYVFSYRKDRPFNQMPKLHVLLASNQEPLVEDQTQPLASSAVQVEEEPTFSRITIPEELLGKPDRVMTSARTVFGTVPLDWSPWRLIELP